MKRSGRSRLYRFGLVIGLFCFLAACDRSEPNVAPPLPHPVKVSNIEIYPTELELTTGHKQQLSATLGDAAGNRLNSSAKARKTIADSRGRAGRLVTWISNQPSVAEVDAAGLVTALAEGTAEITATSEDVQKSVKVIVSAQPDSVVWISPIRASVSVGESLQLMPISQGKTGDEPNESIAWSSNQPSRASVNQNGLVTANEPGEVIITAQGLSFNGQTTLSIRPAKILSGLNFPGNAGTKKTISFEFTSPLAAYPATYIWQAYPRQQLSYYTAFFWGNNGPFYKKDTYYGFHPYPDWNTTNQHFWEVAAPPGGDFLSQSHVVYDRWYIQVAICKQEGNKTVEEFYWDWPDKTKVVRHEGERPGDPPVPALVVGDAPWNQGNEVWDGVLRGFQFYNVAMNLDEIAKEIASPGSVRTPWYLNLNPTPDDVLDKSGSNHHPSWVGTERPVLWRGTMTESGIIRTTVPPR